MIYTDDITMQNSHLGSRHCQPENLSSPKTSNLRANPKTFALQKSFTQPDIIDPETKKSPGHKAGLFPLNQSGDQDTTQPPKYEPKSNESNTLRN
jgi:hypothetical protein